MSERAHRNIERPIPAELHHDFDGRMSAVGKPRLREELARTRGHIRGPKAESLYRALDHRLNNPNRTGRVESWAEQTPEPGYGKHFR